ncbi:MAG: hypothetical protein Q9200_007222 [Gallowayella weberi]
MFKKAAVILEQRDMKDILGRIQSNDQKGSATSSQKPGKGSPIVIRSDKYVGIGCDLRDIAQLNETLEEELHLDSCLILCTAEVSITYMDVASADALIQWVAQYNDVRFCLLEQILPDGQNHPFAQKMMQHFEKLGTPLNCVRKYPSLKDQETRFLQAGYHTAKGRTLWDFWQDPSATTPEVRRRINTVEPFDEWEEFALFSSHYLILEARKSSATAPHANETETLIPNKHLSDHQPNTQVFPAFHGSEARSTPSVEGKVTQEMSEVHLQMVGSEVRTRRKFGAMIRFSEKTVGLHGGIGNEGRLNTTDRYELPGIRAESKILCNPPLDMQARVCHTITALDDSRCLLVGGRTSPDIALRGCWLRHSGQWRSVQELPIPLYRHCATAVAYGTEYAGVLVFGGRTTGGVVVNSWWFWQETTGWDEVLVTEQIIPRFGAAITSTGTCYGLLVGGMTEEGILCEGIWGWDIEYGGGRDPKLQLNLKGGLQIAPRMGACLIWSTAGLLLIGGISKSLIPYGEEILCLSKRPYGQDTEIDILAPVPLNVDFGEHRMLLVGHAAYAVGNTLLLAGGGAVCFSFGSYWNLKTWTLNFSMPWIADVANPPSGKMEQERQAENLSPTSPLSPQETKEDNWSEEVLRVTLKSAEDFDLLIGKDNPFVMEDLDLGLCTKQWTVEELTRKIGSNRLVTVHQARSSHMNFQLKDFNYVKKPFGDFVLAACNGSPQYLRSLSTERPTEEPARFCDDFPGLRDQFHLPPQLQTVDRNQHSSPLRISGPVNMWLHYDVMANVLCQIVGEKVVTLYPPMDAVHFKIPPGSSSSHVNVFHPQKRGHVNYARHHFRAALKDGDVLYIPPLWLHSVSPLDNLSVSINVFFRSMSTGYSAGRDVYGNRDFQAYENGRKTIEKIVKSVDSLPRDVGSAYLVRLGEELAEKGRTHQQELI